MEKITIKSPNPNTSTITIQLTNSIDVEKILLYIKKEGIKADIKESKSRGRKNEDVISKEEFLADLKAGLKEVKEIQGGKKKKNTMKDFNNYVKS